MLAAYALRPATTPRPTRRRVGGWPRWPGARSLWAATAYAVVDAENLCVSYSIVTNYVTGRIPARQLAVRGSRAPGHDVMQVITHLKEALEPIQPGIVAKLQRTSTRWNSSSGRP